MRTRSRSAHGGGIVCPARVGRSRSTSYRSALDSLYAYRGAFMEGSTGTMTRTDNPLAREALTDVESGTPALEPSNVTLEQKYEQKYAAMEARHIAAMEARLEAATERNNHSTAAALAGLASAPTNWHQAMICASFVSACPLGRTSIQMQPLRSIASMPQSSSRALLRRMPR